MADVCLWSLRRAEVSPTMLYFVKRGQASSLTGKDKKRVTARPQPFEEDISATAGKLKEDCHRAGASRALQRHTSLGGAAARSAYIIKNLTKIRKISPAIIFFAAT